MHDLEAKWLIKTPTLREIIPKQFLRKGLKILATFKLKYPQCTIVSLLYCALSLVNLELLSNALKSLNDDKQNV